MHYTQEVRAQRNNRALRQSPNHGNAGRSPGEELPAESLVEEQQVGKKIRFQGFPVAQW